MSVERIAIVGAGIAGLSCAQALHAAGRQVVVFEKEAAPGGRCATRDSAAGTFDIGTASFGAITEPWRAAVEGWAQTGLVQADPEDPGRWLARPGMSALPRHLAEGLELRLSTEIAGCERQETGRWSLRAHAGPDTAPPAETFDTVVIAVPGSQGVPLLTSDAALAEAARAARSEPAWCVMAAWPTALPVRTHRLGESELADSILAAAWRDDAKPGRPRKSGIGCRWVLQAKAYWSANNLDVPPHEVTRHLLEAFSKAVGMRLARPTFGEAHCWRNAHIATPNQEPCGWNPDLRLGTCGDNWHASKDTESVERAWQSGQALARLILTHS